MRFLSIIVLATAFMAAPAFATGSTDPWPDMNKQIDQTNFIVEQQCSGTLISIKERLILTNDHCVETNVSIVEEEITNEDGEVSKRKREKYMDVKVEQGHYKGFAQVGMSSYLTEIVAHDKKRDLAILRFKQDDIPFTIASPLLPDGIELVRGQRIITVGNPMLLEATLVRGEISSLTRQMEVGGDDKRDYIQMSGGLFGGNSGGALYDEFGRLIGVPAAGSRAATFIGLAIPIQSVKELLRDNCLASVFDSTADDKKCADDKAKAKAGKKEARAGDGGTVYTPAKADLLTPDFTTMDSRWPLWWRAGIVQAR